MTDIYIANVDIGETEPLVTLTDDYVALEIQDFTLQVAFHYEALSTPPFLVDLGDHNLTIANLTFKLEGKPILVDGNLQMEINTLILTGGADFDFDGLSDLSLVASDVFNWIVSTVFTRLQSIIKYELKSFIEPAINEALNLIPHDIPINGTDLHLKGGLSQNPPFDHTHLTLPLNYRVESESIPVPMKQQTDLPLKVDGSHELYLQVSQFILDSALYIMHKEGWFYVEINSTDNYTISSDLLSVVIPEIDETFGPFDPCRLVVYTTDPAPSLNMFEGYSNVTGKLNIEIYCVNASYASTEEGDEDNYVHGITLVSDFWLRFNVSFVYNISSPSTQT